jgi:hypothetical protein
VLLALMDHLNREGRYTCLYVNIEAAQAARGNVQRGMAHVCHAVTARAVTFLNETWLQNWWCDLASRHAEEGALTELLERWARENAKPIVLLLDEVDALVSDTLISLLRQIRAGYAQRPRAFPQTIVLYGVRDVRDVRDYRMHTAGSEIITGGSAFNIKAESLRLGNFSQEEIATLYEQHATETGQTFLPEALTQVWHLSRGQPWVVNALAYEACFKLKARRDHRQPITAELIQQAKENLIERRETHLDQLTDKLREPRIQGVISRLLSGESPDDALPTDDLLYAQDLGLVTLRPQLAIANALYQEIIPRELT